MDCKQRALLQTWYERYGDELYRTLCGAVKSADLSEDIIQETFAKMAVYVSKSAPEHLIDNPRAFLYKVAYNELYSRLRRQKLEQHLKGVFSDTDYEVSDTITPEDIALNREQLKGVENLIAKLPKKQRTVMQLSRVKNLTHAEIAEQVGIKKGSVKQHIVRALALLRGAGYG